jgi:hypothetical protein
MSQSKKEKKKKGEKELLGCHPQLISSSYKIYSITLKVCTGHLTDFYHNKIIFQHLKGELKGSQPPV